MSEIFIKILNMSITASYIVLAILLLRLAFRKAPKWIMCLMWSFVALRLIFPFSIESSFSLIPSASPIPSDIIGTESVADTENIPDTDCITDLSSSVLPETEITPPTSETETETDVPPATSETEKDTEDDVTDDTHETDGTEDTSEEADTSVTSDTPEVSDSGEPIPPDSGNTPDDPSAGENGGDKTPVSDVVNEPEVEIPTPEVESPVPSAPAPDSITPTDPVKAPPRFTALDVFSTLWLVGATLMLFYATVTYFRVKRGVDEAWIMEDNIYICDRIYTPFILGMTKPRIYLPSDMKKPDISFVIAHEKAHLTRFDHIWKPLGFLLLALHWFNPLMWIAYTLLCRDIELACDEKVISALGEDVKKPYSEALIHSSGPHRAIAACPLAFGEIGVKERIRSVLSYKKPAFWAIALAIVTVTVTGVCLLTDPITDKNGETDTSETTDTETDATTETDSGTETETDATTDSETTDPTPPEVEKSFSVENVYSKNGIEITSAKVVEAYGQKRLILTVKNNTSDVIGWRFFDFSLNGIYVGNRRVAENYSTTAPGCSSVIKIELSEQSAHMTPHYIEYGCVKMLGLEDIYSVSFNVCFYTPDTYTNIVTFPLELSHPSLVPEVNTDGVEAYCSDKIRVIYKTKYYSETWWTSRAIMLVENLSDETIVLNEGQTRLTLDNESKNVRYINPMTVAPGKFGLLYVEFNEGSEELKKIEQLGMTLAFENEDGEIIEKPKFSLKYADGNAAVDPTARIPIENFNKTATVEPTVLYEGDVFGHGNVKLSLTEIRYHYDYAEFALEFTNCTDISLYLGTDNHPYINGYRMDDVSVKTLWIDSISAGETVLTEINVPYDVMMRYGITEIASFAQEFNICEYTSYDHFYPFAEVKTSADKDYDYGNDNYKDALFDRTVQNVFGYETVYYTDEVSYTGEMLDILSAAVVIRDGNPAVFLEIKNLYGDTVYIRDNGKITVNGSEMSGHLTFGEGSTGMINIGTVGFRNTGETPLPTADEITELSFEIIVCDHETGEKLETATFTFKNPNVLPEFDKTATVKTGTVYEKNGIKIDFTGMEFTDEAIELTFSLDYPDSLYFRAWHITSINGYSTAKRGGFANSDSKGTVKIDIGYTDLSQMGLTELADFSVSFAFSEDDDVYEGMESSYDWTENVFIKTSLAKDYDYSVSTHIPAMKNGAVTDALGWEMIYHTDGELYSANGLEIVSASIIETEVYYDHRGMCVLLEVINRTKDDATVIFDGTTVNGLRLTGEATAEVFAGQRVLVLLSVGAYFDEYGIDTIGSFEVTATYADNAHKSYSPSVFSFTVPDAKNDFDRSGEVVYDKDGVKVIYKEVIGKDAPLVIFLLENSSGHTLDLRDENKLVKPCIVNGNVTESHLYFDYVKDGDIGYLIFDTNNIAEASGINGGNLTSLELWVPLVETDTGRSRDISFSVPVGEDKTSLPLATELPRIEGVTLISDGVIDVTANGEDEEHGHDPIGDVFDALAEANTVISEIRVGEAVIKVSPIYSNGKLANLRIDSVSVLGQTVTPTDFGMSFTAECSGTLQAFWAGEYFVLSNMVNRGISGHAGRTYIFYDGGYTVHENLLDGYREDKAYCFFYEKDGGLYYKREAGKFDFARDHTTESGQYLFAYLVSPDELWIETGKASIKSGELSFEKLTYQTVGEAFDLEALFEEKYKDFEETNGRPRPYATLDDRMEANRDEFAVIK